MTEKQFGKLIGDIQLFMGLDNWQLNYKFEEIEEENVMALCKKIFYSYFKVYIDFSDDLLNSSETEIQEVIFHELSHIYTSQALILFEDEQGFFQDGMGKVPFIMMSEKMHILNEQQTELLSRRFKELYLNLKPNK